MAEKPEPYETGHDPSIHHGAAGVAGKPDLRDIETAADLEQQTNQGAQGGSMGTTAVAGTGGARSAHTGGRPTARSGQGLELVAAVAGVARGAGGARARSDAQLPTS